MCTELSLLLEEDEVSGPDGPVHEVYALSWVNPMPQLAGDAHVFCKLVGSEDASKQLVRLLPICTNGRL